MDLAPNATAASNPPIGALHRELEDYSQGYGGLWRASPAD